MAEQNPFYKRAMELQGGNPFEQQAAEQNPFYQRALQLHDESPELQELKRQWSIFPGENVYKLARAGYGKVTGEDPRKTLEAISRNPVEGALVRGLGRTGRGLAHLPVHALESTPAKKATKLARIAAGKLLGEDPEETLKAVKHKTAVRKWYEDFLAGQDKDFEAMLKGHPEWSPNQAKNFADLITHPDKLAETVLESAPLLVTAGLATAAGIPSVGATMIFAVEGQEAYDQAITAGQSEDTANDAYLIYGTVAAALEQMQLKGFIKIGKEAKRVAIERAIKKLTAEAAKKPAKGGMVEAIKRVLKSGLLKETIKEAAEEVAQGRWQEATAYILYGKTPEGGIKGMLDRSAQEALIAGATAGVAHGAGKIVGLAQGGKRGTVDEIQQRATEIMAAIDQDPDLTPEQKAAMFDELGAAVEQREEQRQEPFEGTLEAAAKAGDTQQPTQPVAEKVYMKGFAAKLTAIRNNADNMVAGAGNKVNQKKAMRKDLQQITGHYESIADEIEQNKADMPELDEIKQLLPAYKQTVEAFIKSPTEEGFGQIKEIGDKIGELGAAYGEGISTERAKEMAAEAPAEKEKAKLRAKEYAKNLKTELKNQQDREKAIKKIASKWEKKIGQNGLTRQEAQQKALEEIKATGYLSAEPEKAAEAKPVAQLTPEDKARDEEIGRLFGLALEGDKDAAAKLEKLTTEQIAAREKPLNLLDEDAKFSATGEKDTGVQKAITNLAKKRAHVLARNLGVTDEERKAIQKELTGKESMKDMTPEEAQKVVEHFMAASKEQGIVTATGDEIATYIREASPPQKVKQRMTDLLPGQEEAGVKTTWATLLDWKNKFFMGQNRIHRLVKSLDGFVFGPVYHSVFKPTVDNLASARDETNARITAWHKQFEGMFTTDGKVDKDAVNKFLAEERPYFTKATATTPAVRLNSIDKMGIYIYVNQPGSQKRLSKGNFAGFANADPVIADVLQAITPKEKALADWMVENIAENADRFFQAAKQAGVEVKEEDRYFPMRNKGKTLDQQHDYVDDLIAKARGEQIRAAIPSEAKERKKGVTDPLDLDVLTTFVEHVIRVEQFIHMAPVAKQVGGIMNSPAFKAAVNERTDGLGHDAFKTWLSDSIRGYVPDTNEQLGKVINFARKKSVVYLLAGNVVSASRNYLSAFLTSAVHPAIGARVVANFAKYNAPSKIKALRAEINKKSLMMKNVTFDREFARMKREARAKNILKGKEDWDQRALVLQRMTDYHVRTIAWLSAYDAALEHAAEFGLNGSEAMAIEYADAVVRDTQTMGDVEDLPGWFRGGPVSKGVTAFLNDANQVIQFFSVDTYKAMRAGKISKTTAAYRVLIGWILPAIIVGMLRRVRFPEDLKELAFDIGAFPLAGLPIMGDYINSVSMGFEPDLLGPTSIALNEAVRTGQAIVKGNVKGTVIHGGKTVGAATGKIPAQAFRTGEGAWDLATRETDDWRRLLWSKWSVEVAGKSDKEETSIGRGTSSRRGTVDRRGTPSRR